VVSHLPVHMLGVVYLPLNNPHMFARVQKVQESGKMNRTVCYAVTASYSSVPACPRARIERLSFGKTQSDFTYV
jgi:hypothetical protein